MSNKTAYLTIGKDNKGNYHAIDTQVSGRTDLVCPFCGVPLIAAIGKVRVPHFRHDGDSCKESYAGFNPIDGWTKFGFSLPPKDVQWMRSNVYNRYYLPTTPTTKISNFCEENAFSHSGKDRYVLNSRGKIVVGTLPISRFNIWIRNELRLQSEKWLKQLMTSGDPHKIERAKIECWRISNILSSHLYFLGIRI